MKCMRILLIEDDPQLGSTLQRAIEEQQFLLEWVQTAEQAEIAIQCSEFDLLILDWNLPAQSGLSWLKEIRQRAVSTPVLMLTAKVNTEDKILGLDAGADDYLSKPFDLHELLARMRALSRRGTVQATQKISGKYMQLNLATHVLETEERAFTLSKNEMLMMSCLIKNAGHYISKRRLEEAISHWNEPVTDNAVEAQISRLRKRIGRNKIITLRGVGYKVEK